MSRPVRARGLKLPKFFRFVIAYYVAPRAGAWIETKITACEYSVALKSRPVRARGLKLSKTDVKDTSLASRPVRARGLKHGELSQLAKRVLVAPRAGAWIETITRRIIRAAMASRAPCGRVD